MRRREADLRQLVLAGSRRAKPLQRGESVRGPRPRGSVRIDRRTHPVLPANMVAEPADAGRTGVDLALIRGLTLRGGRRRAPDGARSTDHEDQPRTALEPLGPSASLRPTLMRVSGSGAERARAFGVTSPSVGGLEARALAAARWMRRRTHRRREDAGRPSASLAPSERATAQEGSLGGRPKPGSTNARPSHADTAS